MATKSISQLDTQATANETDLFEVAIVDQNSASGYASKKESAAAIADAIVGSYQYPLRITGTTAKTIAGAINELKQLVDLLPQFAIEVVNTLPVSDISTTTIYLVPAQDPEQGNYYEEYIYVNNAWELVGTTAVDLSGYYTSAQVDTLLAGKANTSSLATVATSGAYSDLSGKPTIDTALDTTSTNAVENRAVASEINSIKSDITVDGSASGDIATFVDGSDNPLRELEISIEAVQSGSGDPSPTNVRTITGWTGANIYKKGFNLWDEEWELGLLSTSTGSNYPSNNNIRSKNYIPVLPNTTYYFNSPKSTGNGMFYYGIDKSFLYNTTLSTARAFTTPANCYYLRFDISSTYGTTYNNDISINYPSTETNYHSYAGTTINIDWEDVAGTICGGTINPLTGLLTVIKIMVDMGDLSWNKGTISGYTYFTTRYMDCIQPLINEDVWPQAECFKGRKVSYFNSIENNEIMYRLDAQGFCVRCDDYATSTPEEFAEAMQGKHIVYELATPITYQLTPTEIHSLLGINNIWADCGAITELKYIRDLNLCINDIITRIEALEGGSNTRSLSVSPVLTKSLTSDSDKSEGKTEETEEETKEEAQR